VTRRHKINVIGLILQEKITTSSWAWSSSYLLAFWFYTTHGNIARNNFPKVVNISYMEQSTSSEANSHLSSQIPLWTPKFQWRRYKNPPLDILLSQMNADHIPTSYIFQIHLLCLDIPTSYHRIALNIFMWLKTRHLQGDFLFLKHGKSHFVISGRCGGWYLFCGQKSLYCGKPHCHD
jgi:hypothetical protein